MTHITDEQLVAYALDDVEAGTRATVEAHVESCAACRASLDEIRATLDARRGARSPGTRRRLRREGVGAHRVATRREASHLGTSALRHRTSAPRHSGTSAHRPCAWRPGSLPPRRCCSPSARTGSGVTTRESAPRRRRRRTCRRRLAPRPSASAWSWRRSASTSIAPSARWWSSSTASRAAAWTSPPSRPGRAISSRPTASIDRLPAAQSPALSQVLEDLEPVLLEIANSPSQLTSDEFEALRDRIEARSLVFKVRVTGADVRARERALIRRGESQS